MKRIARFIKAMWKYILYGKKVSFEEFVNRLTICSGCPCLNKEKWTCGKCGCPLLKKAKMSTENCLDGRW